MFDRYYCIVILSLENFGKTFRKVHFCITIMAHKSMKDSLVLKSHASTARELPDKYMFFAG